MLGTAIAERGVAHLVITGGGILEKVLAAMAAPRAGLDWQRVHVWWGDERYVPHDSDDRNDLPAFAKLLDHVDVDPAHVHRMPASDAGFDDAEAAAAAYAADLAQHADPGAARPGVRRRAARCRPGRPLLLAVPAPPGARRHRLCGVRGARLPQAAAGPPDTDVPALDGARAIWFVASGDGKAEATARAVDPSTSVHDVPSSGPRGTGQTLWLIDRDAAGQLPT